MAGPIISVVTVTRNRPRMMMKKLESLARQTLPPDAFELVVCVNGDQRGSEALLAAAEVPFHVQMVVFADNRGAGVGTECLRRNGQG